MLLLIIVAALLISAGVWYFYFYSQQPNEQAQVPNSLVQQLREPQLVQKQQVQPLPVAKVVLPPPQPVDCQVGEWTNWSTGCSSDAKDQTGTLYRRRTRQITRFPSNGGKQCPALEDKQECQAQKVGKFIGGGVMKGSYVDLIVKGVSAQPYSTDAKVALSNVGKNIDKRIRIWYQNQTPVGIGFEEGWQVPIDFGKVTIMNLAGGFQLTSALELITEFNTANRYKLLLFDFDLKKALVEKTVQVYYAYNYNGNFSSYVATLNCDVSKGESFAYSYVEEQVQNAVDAIQTQTERYAQTQKQKPKSVKGYQSATSYRTTSSAF